mmetsp:Transcript_18250/g.42816  ORF Transcript_18250/g.42816 Transcript_18250/m.42816 type:complete len:252 (+) Transcript_18250:477-1232(+)
MSHVPVRVHLLWPGGLCEVQEPLQEGPAVPLSFQEGLAAWSLQRASEHRGTGSQVQVGASFDTTSYPPGDTGRPGLTQRPAEMEAELVRLFLPEPSRLQVQDLDEGAASRAKVVLCEPLCGALGRPCSHFADDGGALRGRRLLRSSLDAASAWLQRGPLLPRGNHRRDRVHRGQRRRSWRGQRLSGMLPASHGSLRPRSCATDGNARPRWAPGGADGLPRRTRVASALLSSNSVPGSASGDRFQQCVRQAA